MSSDAPSPHLPALRGPAPEPPPPEPFERRAAEQGDTRTLAAFCHLGGLVWLVGLPGVVGVLVPWLCGRDRSAFVDENGREALNFHLSLLVYELLLGALAFVTCGLGALVAVPLVLVMTVAALVCSVLGALEASNGRTYRYPLTLRLVR